MRVSFVLPAPSSVLLSNLIGVLGLVGIVVAIGGLTGNWWWSVLAGGAVGVAVAYVAYAHAAQPASVAATASTAPPPAQGPATAPVRPEPPLRAAS